MKFEILQFEIKRATWGGPLMATGRSRTFALSLLALTALGPIGCAGPNPFTTRQTTIGSLKASVSQLEFENEKLRKDVGEMKAENSRLDNQLVQEREANGELSARLDDAKDLLRRQSSNSNAQAMGGSSSNFEDDIPPPVATPKARRVRTNRQPPAASIRPPESVPNSDDLSLQIPRRTPPDIGPSDRNDDDVWLPVARGLPSAVQTRQ
jgi:hypothetical protein